MRLGEIAKTLNQHVLSEKEIEELHQVLLIILDDLIEICKCYNLHFILIGGSAIGALRDKGCFHDMFKYRINGSCCNELLL